ncbi:uncharacterized protein LOC132945959 [Metopolophium dirhodum]|uniref:uncharacterized protein LOC132945959 n=1 Tax=Metopolophium dirhodum TaxID=44670 RepID=UPI00298F8ECB|nr:uncharacterized protein LOC132945959 [Metopolophium dirhodum]
MYILLGKNKLKSAIKSHNFDENNIEKIEYDEIVKINKNENNIEKIEYGKNKFKNAIKSYNLSLEKDSKINSIMKTWHESKKEYYEDQIKVLKKKKKCALYFTTKKWCEEMKDASKTV